MIAIITAYICLTKCIMSSGYIAFEGAAACPRNIPYFTEIKIEDFGRFICLDHTALKHNERYDLFFGYGKETKQKAIIFGKQKKEITIKNDK